ncbi:hypothetical protein [Kitasatospora sp. NPDC056181]|uniref:hypothetical protein n=1 Tax=Kitasatospora sp. NPDC056181 TaxID=3345737 RepID=UPI0035D55204
MTWSSEGLAVLEEIKARIAAGASPAEIRRSLWPGAWEPLLKACAAARTFDRELLDGVLRPAAGPGAVADSPTLDRLTELGIAEPVPDEPGQYRLTDGDQAAYMQAWRVEWEGRPTAPAELADLERRLADHRGRSGDRVEQLRHLLVADPAQALKLFDELFVEADGARDFARCQDLLDVLDDPDRLTLAGPDVAHRRKDRAAYVGTQGYWAVDYARCAQYLTPPGLENRAAALLSGTGERVWQVFASAGMGKTMQLRWLVTRYCAPAERDVPCARIDFDVVSPAAVGRHPWLVLLEAAAQFGNRWPQGTFGRLDRFAPYRSLLDRRASGLSSTAAQGLGTQDTGQVRSEVTELFVDRFNEAAGDRPALLVCDTLEELLLRGGEDFKGFLELLGQVLRGCPQLRLVLAGRYDIEERFPGALDVLGRVVRVEVEPFTDEQAERYLGEIRGIDDPAKRKVARCRSNGRPLTLALFADAIVQDPGLSTKTLQRMQGPLTTLLIRRVIRRIEDERVRWLVRYGVVPRKLRRKDLFTVMRPFLRNMDRPTRNDDPRRDAHGLEGQGAYPFTAPPADDAELVRIWDRLLDYAGGSSWVSEVAGDPSAVVFHPDVVAPQRRLISDKPVFWQLHQAYARYFDGLAEKDPGQWADHTREAVYHRFQLRDPQAVEYWRSALRRARDADALEDLHTLAGEVLGGDYLDGRGRPWRSRHGRPLIAYAALAEARLQEAYIIGRRALRDQAQTSDPRWDGLQQALDHVELLRGDSPEPIPVSGLEEALRAMHLSRTDGAERAAAVAEQALRSADEQERADVLRVLADSRAAVGDPAAEELYRQAYELALLQGREVLATDIALALAREREEQGRLDEALRWCDRAAVRETTGVDRVALTKARLLLACYRPAEALEGLPEPPTEPGSLPWTLRSACEPLVEAALLRAQAELMLGRSERALRALDRADEAATGIPGAGRYRFDARIHQLRGTVLGERLDIDEAEQYFRQAESTWAEFGYRSGHPECRYLYARFLLRDVGDLAETRQLLTANRRSQLQPLGELPVPEEEFVFRTELLERELQLAQAPGTAPDGEPVRPASPMTPRQSALLATQQLVETWWRGRPAVPVLVEALGAIEPPSARLFVLEELRRCPTPRGSSGPTIGRLRGVLEEARGDGGHPEDAALRRQLLAELDRLGHRPGRAVTAADEARSALHADSDPLAWWRWFELRARLGAAPAPARSGFPPMIADRHPLLYAAALLRLAAAAPGSEPDLNEPDLVALAVEVSSQVGRTNRYTAEAFRRLAETTGDAHAQRTADRLYKRLGRPQGRSAASPREGRRPDEPADQLAVPLPFPGELPVYDPDALQRDLLRDQDGVVGYLSDLLAEAPVPVRPLGEEIRVLRLESDDPFVHALPWELAVVDLPVGCYRSLPAAADAGNVLHLQTTLRLIDPGLPVDGFLGPRTRQALTRLMSGAEPVEATAPTERPSVVIVAPSSDVQYESRGSHLLSGVDLADVYASRRFEITLAESVDSLRRPGSPPRLVHVSAPLESTAAEPYFDLSSARQAESRVSTRSRGFDLSAPTLARWLRDAPDCLVVLDPPMPGSPRDIPEQLIGRNLFAAQLLAELPAAAVIGIGLDEYHAYRSADLIASAVAEARPLAEAFRELVLYRSQPGLTGLELLAAAGTALFAAPATYNATYTLS